MFRYGMDKRQGTLQEKQKAAAVGKVLLKHTLGERGGGGSLVMLDQAGRFVRSVCCLGGRPLRLRKGNLDGEIGGHVATRDVGWVERGYIDVYCSDVFLESICTQLATVSSRVTVTDEIDYFLKLSATTTTTTRTRTRTMAKRDKSRQHENQNTVKSQITPGPQKQPSARSDLASPPPNSGRLVHDRRKNYINRKGD